MSTYSLLRTIQKCSNYRSSRILKYSYYGTYNSRISFQSPFIKNLFNLMCLKSFQCNSNFVLKVVFFFAFHKSFSIVFQCHRHVSVCATYTRIIIPFWMSIFCEIQMKLNKFVELKFCDFIEFKNINCETNYFCDSYRK